MKKEDEFVDLSISRKKQKEEILNQKIKDIDKEKRRLNKLFKNIPKNKKELSMKLIDNAAFMSITLEDLKEDILKFGVKETYLNGKDQFGYKESVESKTYNIMIKNYMNIIKQLNELLPTDEKINEDDEFDKFNNLK